MPEYIEREALIAWIEKQKRLSKPLVIMAVQETPAADVEPVVRCKDCKHIRPEVDAYTGEAVGCWCGLLDLGSIEENHFCSYGERKEG